MGKILIDTGQVRSLRDVLRETSGVVRDVRVEVRTALAAATLNPSIDPALRSAGIERRTASLSGSLDGLRLRLDTEVGHIDRFVGRAEGIDRIGTWVLPRGLWPVALVPWRSPVGGVRLPRLPSFTSMVPTLRVGFGRSLASVTRVGRGMLGAGRSLISEGVGALDRLRRRAQDKIKSYLAAAWNAIWDRVTGLFQQVSAEISRLGKAVAEKFKNTYQAVIATGRRTTQVAWWYLEARIAPLIVELGPRILHILEGVDFIAGIPDLARHGRLLWNLTANRMALGLPGIDWLRWHRAAGGVPWVSAAISAATFVFDWRQHGPGDAQTWESGVDGVGTIGATIVAGPLGGLAWMVGFKGGGYVLDKTGAGEAMGHMSYERAYGGGSDSPERSAEWWRSASPAQRQAYLDEANAQVRRSKEICDRTKKPWLVGWDIITGAHRRQSGGGAGGGGW